MFYIARFYARFYFLIRCIFGFRIPGLGRILRTLKKPRTITVNGIKLYFSPQVASEYGIHLIGEWQEPETHIFLEQILKDYTDQKGLFVDVGSNIGIFLLDVAIKSDFRVVGFEPSSACIEATQKSFLLNDIEDFELHNVLVGAENKFVPFKIQNNIEGASIHTSLDATETMKMVALDTQLPVQCENAQNTIILIDVEGYELEVLKGARNFVKCNSPLVIFEYNHVSRKHFNIDQIQNELGPEYVIYRLRKDALLDQDLNKTWNCVAVNKNSHFLQLCNKLIGANCR